LREAYQNENLKVGDSEYRLVETLTYVPVKPSDRNEVGADEFKREFLQTKLKTEDDEATELLRNAEISVNEKQIKAFDKNQNLTGWKYIASKNLPAFEIICTKNDLREDYKNENVKVGDSEYRLVDRDCSICRYPWQCQNARFYCEAQHVFCEGCLQENERIGSKECPNCRGMHYGGELTTLGKIAHSTVGKALQAILVILFTVFAMLSYNHFLISPFLPFFNVAVDFIVYIVGLFTLFTVRAVIFFIFHSFVSKKFLLPVLNFIQPYNLTSARHYRIMFVSRVLYWFALIVYVRSLFFL
jgi:hypothetical protein